MPVGVMPQSKQKVGRPTLFTPDRVEAFTRARGLGCTLPEASALAGWHPRTASSYLALASAAIERQDAGGKLGAQEQRFAQFGREHARVRANLQQANLARILQTAQDRNHKESVSAAMWTLERLWPREFGRHTVEISGPEGEPLSVEVRVSGVEESLRDFQAGLEAGADASARQR